MRFNPTGNRFQTIPPGDENIVVYILNPFSNGAALADICSAFLRLFQQYVEDSSRRQTRAFHEVVLQIVPLQFVASLDSVAVPPQLDYLRLSLEVYSRCAPKRRGPDRTGCSPALVLAELVPRAVPFKLSSEGISPLEDGRCFHLAYSHSIDQRWITAAWTDYPGRYQMNMSYCLRERGSSIFRPVVDILTDIWGATVDILGTTHRHWRMMIVKCEPMENEEVTGKPSPCIHSTSEVT
jgi:mediator of RNA polymerase II transcription subunit 13